MIDVQQLTKRYGSLMAIEQVTFRVAPGEVVAFLGPNGAGKTTTMRIITGAIPSTDGTVRVGGFDVADAPTEVKRRIGYLPETPPLYFEMTVTEYLRFAGRIKGVPRSELAAAMARALERCALGDVQKRLIGNLSRGYRQRVGLAQALIHDPPVLILDEPTSGLDPKQISEIRELIKRLAGDHTVILSTHILPEATAICQRVVILHHGRIVAEDTPEQLALQLRGADQLRIVVRHPTAPLLTVLQQIEGVRGVVPARLSALPDGAATWIVEYDRGIDLRDRLAREIVAADAGLLELTPVSMSLEEVFLQLTAEEAEPLGHDARPVPSEGAFQ